MSPPVIGLQKDVQITVLAFIVFRNRNKCLKAPGRIYVYPYISFGPELKGLILCNCGMDGTTKYKDHPEKM